jgi:short-subunit dehydrogenase
MIRRTPHDKIRRPLTLLTEGLYAELLETNIGVSVVMPGAVRTEITAHSGVAIPTSASADDGAGSRVTEPDEAARIIVDGIESNRFHIFVGRDARLMNLLNRLAPRLSTRFIQRQMQQLLRPSATHAEG